MGDKSSCTLTMILQFLSTDYDKMKDNCTKQIHFPPPNTANDSLGKNLKI